MLDPRLGGVQVQAAVLDVLVDLLSRFQEGVLDVFTSKTRSINTNVRKEAIGSFENVSRGIFHVSAEVIEVVQTYVFALASKNNRPAGT